MELQIIVCLTLMATVGLLSLTRAAPSDKTCIENEKGCKANGECCGGCCQENKCVPYAEGCVTATNPCYLHDCPPNKTCYLLKVECLQSPCKAIPACKPLDSDYD